MGRNSSGTYTLPEPPFVPSTPISSAAVNSDFSDVADALTDSLSRSGDGGMAAALPLNIAGFFYQGDANTGMSRPSADTQVITCGGTDIVEVTPTGIEVAGDVKSNGISLSLPVGLGPLQWTGIAAPAGWVLAGATYSRATYAALWAFANAQIGLGNTFYGVGDGTTTFTIGTMDGYAPVGVDAAGARISGITHVGDTAGASTVALSLAQLPTGITTTTGVVVSMDLGGRAIPTASTASVSTIPTVTTGNQQAPTTGTTGNWNAVASLSTAGAVGAVSNNTGGTAHPNIQPSRAFKFIVFAGA